MAYLMWSVMSSLCNKSMCKFQPTGPCCCSAIAEHCLSLLCHAQASCSAVSLGLSHSHWKCITFSLREGNSHSHNMQPTSVLLQTSLQHFLCDADVCFLDNKVGWALKPERVHAGFILKVSCGCSEEIDQSSLVFFCDRDADQGAPRGRGFPWSRGHRSTWYSTPAYRIVAFVYQDCSQFVPVPLRSHVPTN